MLQGDIIKNNLDVLLNFQIFVYSTHKVPTEYTFTIYNVPGDIDYSDTSTSLSAAFERAKAFLENLKSKKNG